MESPCDKRNSLGNELHVNLRRKGAHTRVALSVRVCVCVCVCECVCVFEFVSYVESVEEVILGLLVLQKQLEILEGLKMWI